jgi:hypothetical protein
MTQYMLLVERVGQNIHSKISLAEKSLQKDMNSVRPLTAIYCLEKHQTDFVSMEVYK